MLAGDYHSVSARGELSAYLAAIRKYPFLEQEEEKRLAERVQTSGDKIAEERLVTSHLRLVVKLARRYARFGMPFTDLVAEGNLGLLQAVRRFDPNQGCRLATYAAWWIRATIQESIIRGWSLVRLGTTAVQRRLFFSLERAKREIGAAEAGDISAAAASRIGELLKADPREVVSMNRRLAGDQSLHREIAGSGQERIDQIVDERPDPETEAARSEETRLGHRKLNHALRGLNGRERRILEERRLREIPRKLDELSREYGISSERVRQIEQQAIAKLRAFMTRPAFQAELETA